MADRKKVIIVGGGISGTLCAIRLLERIRFPADITIVERAADCLGGGIAYGLADPAHQTNIAAKVMGASDAPDELSSSIEGCAQERVAYRGDIKRHFLKSLFNAAAKAEPYDVTLKTVYKEAVGIADNKNSVSVAFNDGSQIEADKVVVATGHHQNKAFSCPVTFGRSERKFRARFVENQWDEAGKQKMKFIPRRAAVLIIGTALSAYDAARSLLNQGHKGKIMMISRHGHEHFQYPQNHDWKDLSLPRPAFLDLLKEGRFEEAKEKMQDEFRQLTGFVIDLKTQSYYREDIFSDNITERVLKQWEKHIPEIVEAIGVESFGRIVRDYQSLITTLRVGAGHSICNEINAARNRGQLSVMAAHITGIERTRHGMKVNFKPAGAMIPWEKEFHTVISSLGPDHDYSHSQSPLWRDMFARGYTKPHPVGIGVAVDAFRGAGALPGSDNIFVAGTPSSGELMVTKGILVPPAFSIPGMRAGILATADAVLRSITPG